MDEILTRHLKQSRWKVPSSARTNWPVKGSPHFLHVRTWPLADRLVLGLDLFRSPLRRESESGPRAPPLSAGRLAVARVGCCGLQRHLSESTSALCLGIRVLLRILRSHLGWHAARGARGHGRCRVHRRSRAPSWRATGLDCPRFVEDVKRYLSSCRLNHALPVPLDELRLRSVYCEILWMLNGDAAERSGRLDINAIEKNTQRCPQGVHAL